MAGGIDEPDIGKTVPTDDLFDGKGEICPIITAGAQIDELQLLADAGGGADEIGAGEGAFGECNGDEFAVDIRVRGAPSARDNADGEQSANFKDFECLEMKFSMRTPARTTQRQNRGHQTRKGDCHECLHVGWSTVRK